LASGGFATVYLARVAGPGGFEKYVALKLIHTHLARLKSFRDMFLDEARIAAQITHPNVCTVFDFGEAQGTYYLAMEYLLGESFVFVLQQRMMGHHHQLGRRWYPFLARVISEAAEGLHGAHETRTPFGEPLGIVHRDIAPANLFVRYDGHVRVVDFGVARAAGKIHETTAGATKGHFAYMAPEQFQGRVADRRVDIWALGVILWELVTGVRLFQHQTKAETMFNVIERDIPPVKLVQSDVPGALEALLNDLLVRNPERRIQTAREVARRLQDYLVSSGDAMTAADVGGFLDQLAPGGRAAKKQLIAQAASAVSSSSPPSLWDSSANLPAVNEELGNEPTAPSAGLPDTLLADRAAGPVSVPGQPSAATGAAAAPAAPRRGLWLVLGLAMVACGMAAGLWLWHGAGAVAWSSRSGDGPLGGQGAMGGGDAASQRNLVVDAGPVADPSLAVATTVPDGALRSLAETSTGSLLVEQARPNGEAGPEAGTARDAENADDAGDGDDARTEAAGRPTEAAEAAASKQSRRRHSRARQPVGSGWVNITTPGVWAQVFDGEDLLGPTPGRFRLPAGRQRLKIVAGDGSRMRWLTIKVQPNKQRTATVRLGER
jgi:serine/threonine-protein kinase